MEHYDIGIYGVWPGCNYGSVITYYALHQTFRAMGKSVLMIDKPILSADDVELKDTHSRRFAREHYQISEQYSLNEMSKLNDLCDTFVMGSDQVWNYGISRNFGKTYYLDFVNDNKKKLAYAVSFGHGVDFAPPEERERIAPLMARFDGISVRETSGVRLCRDDYHIHAEQVLDPVFLLNPDAYLELAEKSSHRETEPFLAAYILDPTPEKREAILYLSEKLGGLKIINLLDGLPWKFEKNKKLTNLPNCIKNVRVEDWLYYLSHAEFVLTDSCHGASFAMLFHKNFIAIANKSRGFSRFDSLSRLFGFRDRLVTDPKRILTDAALLKPLDYAPIDAKIKAERERSLDWLREHLERPLLAREEREAQNIIKNTTVVFRTPEEQCMGCGACVSICHKDALSLKPDAHGYYRRAIEPALCVNCGKCAAICPAVRLPENHNDKTPECIEFQAADTELLYASSSGGAFGVLANEAFRRGGVVTGVAWSGDMRGDTPPPDWKDDYQPLNVMIDSPEDLYKLRRSKYMQSYPGMIHRQVKEKLDAGQFVLFEGTPCQAAGLRAYLGKDYENLLVVDILCGNGPSAMFFRKYLEGAFPEGIRSYEFRPKSETIIWRSSSSSSIGHLDGSDELRTGGREDDYQRLYHPHVMCPIHCETCRYQSLPRFGDLTIGDFWGIGKREPALDTRKGISVILCGNDKGRAFLRSLPESEIGIAKKVPLEWLGANGSALPGRHNWASPKRDQFYKNILNMSFREAADAALKPDYGYLKTLPTPENRSALRFDTHFSHFRFERDIWEEGYMRGDLTLFVKPERPEVGHYACMPLYGCLEKGQTYMLKIGFTARTDSREINFHIKDSGSSLYQLIHTHRVTPENQGRKIDLNIKFTPNSDIYDEFMIGAAQLHGPERYISFAYIYVYNA